MPYPCLAWLLLAVGAAQMDKCTATPGESEQVANLLEQVESVETAESCGAGGNSDGGNCATSQGDDQVLLQLANKSGIALLATRQKEPPVAALYTYGAPAAGKFVNRFHAEGCFPGLRTYTEDVEDIWVFGRRVGQKKQVDPAAMANWLTHALTPVLVLRSGGDSIYEGCPGQPTWPKNAIPGGVHLHDLNLYRERFGVVISTNARPEVDKARSYSHFASRTYDGCEKAAEEKPEGWTLVGHSALHYNDSVTPVDTDMQVLYQNQDMDCALAFSGTNSKSEFGASDPFATGEYCGFVTLKGYANDLKWIISNSWNYFRPLLARCKTVSVAGHSLGGSLADLFAGCANSNEGGEDFNMQKWEPDQPENLAAVDCSNPATINVYSYTKPLQ